MLFTKGPIAIQQGHLVFLKEEKKTLFLPMAKAKIYDRLFTTLGVLTKS